MTEVHPIEAESYRILRSRIDLSALPPLTRAVTERVIHATADFDYATDLVCDEAALAAGVAALRRDAPVVADVAMVASGITRYPVIAEIRVKDYHVQTLQPAHRTASRIRVTIEWAESGERWMTSGVSEDLIEAAWLALVDGFRLPLMRLEEHGAALLPAGTDSSWAV